MNHSDFDKEIKAIDPGFSIINNPNHAGLYNIMYHGKNYDLPPIGEEVKEELSTFAFSNDYVGKLQPREAVLARLTQFVEQYKRGDWEGL
jgi:hypothetical protein